MRRDPHGLSGAYALDALENSERERFEQHLQRCEACRQEVRGLHDTATQLALAVARVPPPQLRGLVLDAAARTGQNLPVSDHPVSDHRAASQPRHARAQRRVRAPRRAPVRRLLGVAAAAAVAAVAVVLGFTEAATQGRLDRAQAQEQAIVAVLNAPDAKIVAGRVSGGGTATVVFSQADRKMIFTTAGLPPLPSSKVYELWVLGPGQPGSARPAGLLPAPSDGRTAPLLASGLASGDQAGVTVEPAGGTSTPTKKPIVAIPLAG
jgi:anti-sigma-K factor RskA